MVNTLIVNKEVIERVEQKEDGWIVLIFREPHPIPKEVIING